MKTIKSITLISLYWMCLCGLAAQNADKYAIIPQPQVLIPETGKFVINKRTIVLVDVQNDKFNESAKNFVKQVQKVSNINIPIKDITSSYSENIIVFKQVGNLPKEGYEMTVEPNCITIEATQPDGLFYGIQTLYQLLPVQIYGDKKVSKKIKWEIPCCKIKDAPRFAYRGLMLDVGRHFMPKEFIMKLIDIMSMHKQNMFHWHLTEDQGWRIEIKKYPKLTEIGAWRKETAGYEGDVGDGKPHGGFYTQEEVKEIVEFARQKYVTIIPEIELPGHALAIQAANQNQYTILTPNRWCYLDYYQEDPDTEELSMSLFLPLRKVYDYDPIPASLSTDKHKYIFGHQGSVWTEYIQNTERAEYKIFPRAIAMSEVGWNSKENKNWDIFRQKMLKEFQRLDQKEVNYSRTFYRVIYHYDRKTSFPKKVGLSIDYPRAIIRYTINGKAPTLSSPVYSDSITVNNGDVIRAQGFLNNGEKIGEVMQKKFQV